MGSTKGWYGAPNSATQMPSRTVAPCRCRTVEASATRRDLPAPGSPPTNTTCRAPWLTAAQASSSAVNSRRRPTKAGNAVPAQRAGSGGGVQVTTTRR